MSFLFTVCGHHLSPTIATVFLLSNAPHFPMSHPSIFLIYSSCTLSSFLLVQSTFSPYVGSTLVCIAARAPLCVFFVLHPTTDTPFSSFWQVQAPCTKSQFQGFRGVHWAVQIIEKILSLLLTPSIFLKFLPRLPYYFLALAFPSLVLFIFVPSCIPQTSLKDNIASWRLRRPSHTCSITLPHLVPASPFVYFLPCSAISYCEQRPSRRVSYFILPVKLSDVSRCFERAHSQFCS